ncbi:MAG: hypothetical protein EXS13_00355 [Planctomycetes bacterium]|nr:hypothetical protein [Planctomycetota bacterium]
MPRLLPLRPLRPTAGKAATFTVSLLVGSLLGGCASSGGAGSGGAAAAGALGTSAAETSSILSASATQGPIDELVSYISGLLPLDENASPAAQRARMLEQAGTSHFRHEELGAGRAEMARHRAGFANQRAGFVSPVFAASRERLRTGRAHPFSGPVLGGAISQTLANPNLARGILTGVAATGVAPVGTVNPILGQLLPAFGN